MTEKRAPLTADELAAELYRRQGYLVISAIIPEEIGTINLAIDLHTGEGCNTPLRIVGGSTRAEFIAQRQLAERITGERVTAPIIGDFFYRVEAAD